MSVTLEGPDGKGSAPAQQFYAPPQPPPAAPPAPVVPTPTQRLMAEAQQVVELTDQLGRPFSYRRLSNLERLDLNVAVGRDVSGNEVAFFMCELAASIRQFEGQAATFPGNYNQVRALVARYGVALDDVAADMNAKLKAAAGAPGGASSDTDLAKN